jgi:tetratricopeptide (TPR) repeat protein
VAYARRLANRLDLPNHAAEVLGHQRYWTPEFCRLYCDLCDEMLFSNPYGAFAMAGIAPRLVNLLPDGGSKNELMVHALAILGGANRAVGALGDADGCYRTAFAICQRVSIPPLEQADLQRRYTNLLVDQGRFGLALENIESAIDTLKTVAPHGEGDYCLGAALVQRGVLRIHRGEIAESLDDLGLALVALDPKRNERTYYAALHNLAFALTQTGSLSHLYQACRHLRTAKKLLEGRRNCQARYKLYWIEASLLQRLGSTRRAEKSLQIARKGFARIGARIELVLSSAELAILLREHGEQDALAEMVGETRSNCESLGAPPEALDLLDRWSQATEAGTATTAQVRGWGREYESLERAFEARKTARARETDVETDVGTDEIKASTHPAEARLEPS